MIKQWLNRGLFLGMLGVLANAALASYPEYADVQNTDSNTAPGVRESHINDYRFQDEQINVTPDDGLVRVLRTSQKNLVNDYVTATYPIYNATPRELRNVIRRITFLEGGRAEVIQDKVGKQNYVQVIAPQYMLPYLEDAIQQLDVKWLKEYWDGAVDTYIKMQHRKAEFVDRIAENYAGSEGFTRFDTTNNSLSRFDEIYRSEQYAKAVTMADIPANQVELEVKVYEVTASNDLKLGVDYVAWKNGPGRNLFTFSVAGYDDFQRAKGLTSIYDPFIDARAPVLADPSFGKETVANLAARESYRAVNYLLTSNYVDFLQAKGQARVITSQKLLVKSANTGVIANLDQVVSFVNNKNEIDVEVPTSEPFTVVRPNGIISPGAVTDGDASEYFIDLDGDGLLDKNEQKLFKETPTGGDAPIGVGPTNVSIPSSDRELHYRSSGSVGMGMILTPYVGLESMELVIDLGIGELNGFAPNGTPIINTRTVSTTVRLLDGQPFVLAGINRKHDVKNTAKAPWIGSIPVLGYFFGGEQDLKRDSDVVITITPRFFNSNQINIATPPRVKTLDLIMEGVKPLAAPDLDLGYDQWLLDS